MVNWTSRPKAELSLFLNCPPEVERTSRGFTKKYSTEFKFEVVQSFLAGNGGAKLLARRCLLPEEKIRTWVSHYRLHGIDGLRPKRSAHSLQFKLQRLSHQDREQLSSRQVAAIYDIRNANQVFVWRRNHV
jgi:transposase